MGKKKVNRRRRHRTSPEENSSQNTIESIEQVPPVVKYDNIFSTSLRNTHGMSINYYGDDGDWGLYMYEDYKSKMELSLENFIIINTQTIDTEFDNGFGFFCEWKEGRDWKSRNVLMIRKQSEYWKVIDKFGTGKNSSFNSCVKGFEKEVVELLNKIRNCPDHMDRKKLISEYNSLQPIWSFVKTDDCTIIPDRLINRRVKNDISFNLKITKYDDDIIYPIDENFVNGFIPNVVMRFFFGKLSPEIIAIMFSKTVAVRGKFCCIGFRLRIIVKDGTNTNIIQQIKDEIIENDFYKRCVATIN